MVVARKIHLSVSASSFEKIMDEKEKRSMLSLLLTRMNPGNCLVSCGDVINEDQLVVYDEPDRREQEKMDAIIPGLLVAIDIDLKSSPSRMDQKDVLSAKTAALKNVYELSQIENNRILIVCSTKWDIISALAKCLISMGSQYNEIELLYEEIRRFACLILNNLSIPKENKSVIIHSPHLTLLLEHITTVIKLQIPEATYLCCICLMNLTMARDAVEPIMTFAPAKESAPDNSTLQSSFQRKNSIDARDWEIFPTSKRITARKPTPPRQRRSTSDQPWLDDPNSLLRSLEKLMRDQQPFLMSKAFSVEGESIRWAVGLLRNMTVKHRHCVVIAKTEIPALVLGVLERTPHHVIKWDNNSTEEMALTVLDQIAASPAGSEKLRDCGAKVVLGAIQTRAGGSTIVRNKISSILECLLR